MLAQWIREPKDWWSNSSDHAICNREKRTQLVTLGSAQRIPSLAGTAGRDLQGSQQPYSQWHTAEQCVHRLYGLISLKKRKRKLPVNWDGSSLAVQWLRLYVQCRGRRFDPGQGAGIPCRWCSRNFFPSFKVFKFWGV